MVVYDVFQRVTADGARQSSYPQGEWWCEVHEGEERARCRAELFNEKCGVGGVSYHVQAVDECSPERKPERPRGAV